MRPDSTPLKQQSGIVLLEGLIAILIFSLGVLAIVGMQAMAVKQVTDARYRSEAGLLVNDLIGTMWVSNREPAALQANFGTGGAGYEAWKARVAATLPGVDIYPPTVTVDPVTGQVTVTVFWLPPSDQTATAREHRHVAITRIRS